MMTEIPVTEEEKEALRKAAESAKRLTAKLTAKDVPVPEPPKLEMVKEDYNPIKALFGPGVKFDIHRSFWTRIVFGIIFFGLGMIAGFVIGRY